MKTIQFNHNFFIAFLLGILMLLTRFHHFGSSIHLPDGSLAVFFLAGLYLRGRFIFPILLAEAAVIDFIAITQFGVSDFCVTPAYVFLLPAYAAPFLAGVRVSRKAVFFNRNSILSLCVAWFSSASVAFLFSNGGFYWLSGRYADLSFAKFIEQGVHYFAPYISSPLVYVVFGLCIHGLILALNDQKHSAQFKQS